MQRVQAPLMAISQIPVATSQVKDDTTPTTPSVVSAWFVLSHHHCDGTEVAMLISPHSAAFNDTQLP